MRRLLFTATAIAFVSSSASASELITNGGFEQPTIGGSCCNTAPPGVVPGWNVGTGSVNVVIGTFGSAGGNLAYEGSQYLDLIGESGAGSLSQTFATVAGQAYTFSFAYSHNLFAGLSAATATFSIDGLAGLVSHSTGTTADLDWQTYSGGFIADDASATLNFANVAGSGNAGILLDAVSVQTTAVPEPATWALVILGFAGIGGAMRTARRTEKPAVSYS